MRLSFTARAACAAPKLSVNFRKPGLPSYSMSKGESALGPIASIPVCRSTRSTLRSITLNTRPAGVHRASDRHHFSCALATESERYGLMDASLLEIICCPQTHQTLVLLTSDKLAEVNRRISLG